MEKMWMRSVVALALCLSMAACGKSKDGGSSSPAEPPPKPAVPTAPTSIPSPDQNGDMKGNGPQDVPDRSHPRRHQKGSHPGGGGSTSHGVPGGGSSHAHSSGDTKKVHPPEMTLDEMNDGIRYSGAAEDNLREYLTALQDEDTSISSSQKASNEKFARSINKASLRLNSQTGVAQIVLTISSKSKNLNLDLRGNRSRDRKSYKLTSKTRGLSGKLTCLDQLTDRGQTCETSLGEVKYNGSMVQVIFRHTSMELGFVFPERSCYSRECEEIYQMSKLSEDHISHPNTLKKAVMDSYEVVQGKSEFKVLIQTYKNEVIKIGGPLANPELYPTLNTPTDRALTAAELVDPATGQNLRTRLHEALHDVRIIANDGYGQVTVRAKMKLLEDGKRDVFEIKLTRKSRPIVTEPVMISN